MACASVLRRHKRALHVLTLPAYYKVRLNVPECLQASPRTWSTCRARKVRHTGPPRRSRRGAVPQPYGNLSPDDCLGVRRQLCRVPAAACPRARPSRGAVDLLAVLPARVRRDRVGRAPRAHAAAAGARDAARRVPHGAGRAP